jgi:AcrR family transcriptional regulator
VVEQALALAEAEGLEAVTIRRLAQDLGVTPMALYWHFRSKDELLDAMADRLLAAMDLTVDEAAPWQEQFRTLMNSLGAVLRAHPAAALLVATRTMLSESSLRATEVALEILKRAGFSPREATQIVRHALATITNLVAGGTRFTSPADTAGLLEAQRRARVVLEALPPERYPRIIEAAAPLSTCDDPDAYYAFGLDLLLAGIEAMAAGKRSGQRRSLER